ncbi:MAG: hypothetical protein ACYTEG_01660 [Planctomycetota bacterium]
MRYRVALILLAALLGGCPGDLFTTFWPWEFGDKEDAFYLDTPEGLRIYCPAYVFVETEDEDGYVVEQYVLDERGVCYHDDEALMIEAERSHLESLTGGGYSRKMVPEDERFSELSLDEASARADFVASYYPARFVPIDDWYAGFEDDWVPCGYHW